MAFLASLACLAASSPNTVGVLTVFKDEAQGMHEWVHHHRAEGVTEFVLINDNSTDGGERIARELNCTVVDAKYPGNQSANFYEFAHLLNVTWMAVIDLDEYMYAPKIDSSVAQYLRSIELEAPDCGTMLLPWRFYAPAFTEQHPVSVIASSEYTEPFGHSTQVKTITKRSDLCGPTTFDMHRARVTTKQCVSTWPPTRRSEESCASPVTELDGRIFDHPEITTWGPLAEADQQIALNHYNIQSWELYCRVKMKRGDVDGKGNFRDLGYWHQGQTCMPYFAPDNSCGCNTHDDRLLLKRGGPDSNFFSQLPEHRPWPKESAPPNFSDCLGTGPVNETIAALVPIGHCDSEAGQPAQPAQPLLSFFSKGWGRHYSHAAATAGTTAALVPPA